MKKILPLNVLGGIFSNTLITSDFDQKSIKERKKDYFDQDCISHPTGSHCKIYDI